jgi:hypothetical protein
MAAEIDLDIPKGENHAREKEAYDQRFQARHNSQMD